MSPVSSPAQSLSEPKSCAIEPGSPRCEIVTLRRALAVLNTDGGTTDSTSARSWATVQRAHQLFRAACEGGFGDGCYFAAEFTDVDSLAADLLVRGCYAHRPSGAACAGAGDVYSIGISRPRNADSALALYRRGCAMEGAGGRGDPTACYLAGSQTSSVIVLPSAVRESLRDSLLLLACNEGRGSPRGCISFASNLRRYWEQHEDRRFHSARYRRDARRIWAIFEEVCAREFLESCAQLGRLHEAGAHGRPANADSARHYYELACYGGGARPDRGAVPAASSAAGCQMLGDLLLSSGTATDSAAALEHYRLGCDQLSPASCVLHAVHTYRERPVFSIFRTATECESGWIDACFATGQLASRSAVTDTEPEYLELARDYFERACGLDHADACNSLGLLYEQRLRWIDPAGAPTPSVAWSDSTSHLRMKYYRRACDLRNAEGCLNVAHTLQAFYTGRGDAVEYLRLACILGHPDACGEAMVEYRRRGDVVSESRMRGLACRRNQKQCKTKADT